MLFGVRWWKSVGPFLFGIVFLLFFSCNENSVSNQSQDIPNNGMIEIVYPKTLDKPLIVGQQIAVQYKVNPQQVSGVDLSISLDSGKYYYTIKSKVVPVIDSKGYRDTAVWIIGSNESNAVPYAEINTSCRMRLLSYGGKDSDKSDIFTIKKNPHDCQ